jgi:hypothetical protein
MYRCIHSLIKGENMHRLNLTIDEPLFEQVRAVSFLKKISISEIIRTSLRSYLENGEDQKSAMLLLEADDEKEILSIIKENDFSSQDDFAKEFDL